MLPVSAKPVLIIRADASPSIGTGHVMRCLALALAARERGIPIRVVARLDVAWVRERLAREEVAFTEVPGDAPAWEQPEALLAQLAHVDEAHGAGEWVVLDGYHFGLDCQQAVRAAGYKLLVIDDYAHLPEYSCDILLNQNIGAEELVYKGDIGQKLLGPQYALLRPEFLAVRKKAEARRFPEKAQNILLTLGGGYFSEHLARIAPNFAILELAGCTLRVIAGAMPEERIRVLLRYCPARLEILSLVDDMPELLLDTDLCVTAGGSTCWELCCLGVPFLTVKTAENQHNIVHELHKNGIASRYVPETFVTLILDSVAKRKCHHADAGLALVDGLGANRVINAIAG